jgi:hypothetical protein
MLARQNKGKKKAWYFDSRQKYRREIQEEGKVCVLPKRRVIAIVEREVE